MRRTFLIALVVLGCAGSARAETTFTMSFVGSFSQGNSTPFDFFVRLDQLESWQIQNLGASGLSSSFRLDVTTAAGYGVDWAALVDDVDQAGIWEVWTKHATSKGAVDWVTVGDGTRYRAGAIGAGLVSLNWIDVAFSSTPNSDTFSRVTATTRVNVTGVPEPSTFALLVLCCLCAHIRKLPTSRAGN